MREALSYEIEYDERKQRKDKTSSLNSRYFEFGQIL